MYGTALNNPVGWLYPETPFGEFFKLYGGEKMNEQITEQPMVVTMEMDIRNTSYKFGEILDIIKKIEELRDENYELHLHVKNYFSNDWFRNRNP